MKFPFDGKEPQGEQSVSAKDPSNHCRYFYIQFLHSVLQTLPITSSNIFH